MKNKNILFLFFTHRYAATQGRLRPSRPLNAPPASFILDGGTYTRETLRHSRLSRATTYGTPDAMTFVLIVTIHEITARKFAREYCELTAMSTVSGNRNISWLHNVMVV